MSNIPQAPGMPVVPRPADIARYNDWARRHGRPLWGAAAAPAPAAPAPVAPPPLSARRLRKGSQPMPAPADHGAVAPGEGGGWIRGTYPKDRGMYARRTDGTELKLMQWMPRLGKFRLTKWGKDYYSHNRQEFIVNVPCIAYRWDARFDMYIMCTVGHIHGGMPVRSTMPYQRTVPDLDQDPEEVKQKLLREMRAELMSREMLDTDHGAQYLVYRESDLVWCWDESTEITFDEQVVRHIHHNDAIDFDTIMDRPLRGEPFVDEKMYRRMDLCPIATTEITSPGGCVVAQIVATVTKQSKITVGSSSGTRSGLQTRTADGRIDERVDNRKRQRLMVEAPRYDATKVIEKFNKIFAELYPGEAVSEEDYEEGLVEPTRPYPYQFADWLEVGVTSRMVVKFCEEERIALRVLYKNKIIFTSGPQETHSTPVMVYAIHSDHAFFYDGSDAKNGASHLPQGGILKISIGAEKEHMRLRLPFNDDDATPFAEMVEYPGFWRCYEHMVGVEDPDPVVYWCRPSEIKEIKADMLNAEIPFWEGLGNRPETTRSLNFEFGKGKNRYGYPVRIKVVPENVEDFVAFCQVFQEATQSPSAPHGLRLAYNGESMSALMLRALERLAVSQRREWLQWEREAILARQEHRCPGCQDSLGKYEIDHKTPICRGGTNELDNLQALCPLCHAAKTQDEELDVGRMNTVLSQMAPRLWRELHKCPKPTEVSWGTMSTDQLAKKLKPRPRDEKGKLKLKGRLEWARKSLKATRTRHVLDLLMKRANPRAARPARTPDGVSELVCMDAKSCRVFALTKRDRGLPIFSPLDEPLPFQAERLPHLDFVFVDAGEQPSFPYTGARWYAAEVVQYMLEIGAVSLEHCVAGLEASRHMAPAVLELHLETMRRCWEESIYRSEGLAGKLRAERVSKQAILSLIGLWNATEQHAWSKSSGVYQTDAGDQVTLRSHLGEGAYEFKTSVELVSLYTMSPFGRIALDVEQMRISQALRELDRHHELTVVGAHVDGVYALAVGWNDDLRLRLESAHRFADGSPIFHIKKEPASKVPNYQQKDEPRCQTWTLEKHQWKVVRETELTDRVQGIADLFQEHGSMLLSGPAGVGKTVLIHALLDLLGSRPKPVISALRHCAAMLVGGKTLQHYLSKYNAKGGAPPAGTIVVVDEISEVQLHTLQQLAQWKLMGVRFIFAGDLDGQFKPIFDRMADVMKTKDLRLSRFLHEMCNGLHVKLTVYRRGADENLFKWYTGLYKWADDTDPETVARLVALTRNRYPWKEEQIDFHFVMSHKLRVKINAERNLLLAARQQRTLFLSSPGELTGVMMQPQDMYIWEGLELLCHRRKYAKGEPVNGGVYRVYSWDEETVTVRLTEDYRQKYQSNNPEQEDSDEDEEASETAALKKAMEELEGWHTLTHAEAAKILRLQHALVYANIQGRTLREKHVCLLDTANRNFTVRHLIVAVSRATHGKYVHIPDAAQEAKLRQAPSRAVAVRPESRLPVAAPERLDVAFGAVVHFATAAEWMAHTRNRGVLVEQLYRRPNWRRSLKVSSDKNGLRKRLLEMSPEQLADLLVKLDAKSVRRS